MGIEILSEIYGQVLALVCCRVERICEMDCDGEIVFWDDGWLNACCLATTALHPRVLT